MKLFKGIELNGTRYNEDSKCPGCSSEVDKGGRLELKKRTRLYLKCSFCKYSILGEKTRNKINREHARLSGMSY